MKPTQRITSEAIRDLANIAGPCITLVVGGDQAADNAIQLKHAFQTVRAGCASRAIDPEPLLEPMETAVRDLQADAPQSQIAIFRSASTLLAVPVQGLKPLALVDDRFDVRSLLGAAAAQWTFYILALSQNRTRLLRCTENSSEEVPLEGPLSLQESMQTRKPDHVLDNRASGGPSIGSGAVMFGTSSDADAKDEYMLHFFTAIDRAVNNALRGQREALVAVAVEHEIALYRRVNTYSNLCELSVYGAPDGLEGGEMHRRALALLEECAAQPAKNLADFDKKVGTGHASTRIQEIVAAAWQGRVSHLFFRENAQYMGSYDHVRQRVKHTTDLLDGPEDLISAAAWQTIVHNGEARIVPASALPNGVPVCALFRYPAITAQQPEEVQSAA